MGRLLSACAFGGVIATLAILVGTRDLESYDHAVFSLNRGTAVEAVHVFGQPVYTLAAGFGVRLPLHGSLGASPVAALSSALPAPVTYWLLLTFTIAVVVLIVRHALEPACGRVVAWLAAVLLFWSVPVVNYTVYDDWAETAVTYFAFVGCVFAPHTMLTMIGGAASAPARRTAIGAVAASVWALVAIAHPGYWPLIAVALALTGMLTLCRSDQSLRTKVTVVATLAAVSLVAVALPAADIVRDLNAATAVGEVRRAVEGPRGALILSNLFPFGEQGARHPFTYLLLAVVSTVVGIMSSHSRLRRLILGSALISVVLGLGAAALEPGTSPLAPSVSWALRDPATAFAIMSGAYAAAALRTSRKRHGLLKPSRLGAALLLAGLQGPAYATYLVAINVPQSREQPPWTRDMRTPAERLEDRGLPRDRIVPGARVALWPGVGGGMRNTRRATVDFPDAGYPLVTMWTKQRTMRGLIEPNDRLFNQMTELSPRVLCDAAVVSFLRLRYLLMPSEVECEPWTRIPGLLVDEQLTVAVAPGSDHRIAALPSTRLIERLARMPALSEGSSLIAALTPLPGTAWAIESGNLVLRLTDPTVASAQALVLPIAFDPAWQPSTGTLRNVGGLLALLDVNQPEVTVAFVPDGVAVLRALGMTIAQLLSIGAVVGLAFAGSLSKAGEAQLLENARRPASAVDEY